MFLQWTSVNGRWSTVCSREGRKQQEEVLGKKQRGTVFPAFCCSVFSPSFASPVVAPASSCILLASRLGAIVIHLPKIHGAGTRKAVVSGGEL
jgi:hypothetical protein